MSHTKVRPAPTRDPVELLLRRIARRGLSGGLLGGAAIVSVGCTSHDGTSDSVFPVSAVEGDAATRDGAIKQLVPVDSGSAIVADANAAGPDAGAASDAGDDFGNSACKDGSLQLSASALHTSQDFDYLAIRRVNASAYQVGDAGPDDWTTDSLYSVVSERGSQCASATASACTDKIAKNPAQLQGTTCVQACVGLEVVTTKGDSVESWSGTTELKQLLAPFDSVDELDLLVSAAGYFSQCDQPILRTADGYDLVGTMYTSECAPTIMTGYHLHITFDGTITVHGQFEYSRSEGCIGRIPAGLKSRSVARRHSAYGDHLAHCAHLEAASVFAFERLARELFAHGAPTVLIDAALRSAADEVRHAALIAMLARVHGGQPVAAVVESLPVRTLEQIALENATEGCVRETYGALVGAYQAEHAGDLTLAQAMSVIADDEARHAALSHRVHSWALAQLDVAARARIAAAQRRAIDALTLACAEGPDAEIAQLAGLPSAQLATAFVRELSRELWEGTLSYAA